MATLFTSAAMGLLSRTLQALLSKYLSDVDVEGVEVPSFTDSSGWGVRLSNVRLREGTKLVTLPGKLRNNNESRHNDGNLNVVDSKETKSEDCVSVLAEESKKDETGTTTEDGSSLVNKRRGTSSWFSWSKKSNHEEVSVGEDGESARSGAGHSLGDSSLDNAPGSMGSQSKGAENLMLRIGDGGRIGVLDVRLVGKSVHVLVEDAEITVEVVTECCEIDGSAELNRQHTKDEKPVDQKQLAMESAGDRVLAENVLAKVIAAVPNLFLRNVRLLVKLPASNSNSQQVCIELNVEFLSVTDGGDFLTNFGPTKSNEADDNSQSSGESFSDTEAFDAASSSESSDNEFLRKRIRTGRGIDGGISIRLVTKKRTVSNPNTANKPWARERWYTDTNFTFLRIAGLDLNARIFLGTRSEIKNRHNEVMDYEEDLDLDTSFLFAGCDYVVPGPRPAIRHEFLSQEALNHENIGSWETANEAAKFTKQRNGIQTCAIPSYFHKAARGLKPQPCNQCHSPSVQCERCWNSNDQISDHSLMDNSSPLGGLVCQVHVRDLMEINIDRVTLDTVAVLLSLFTKPPRGGTLSRNDERSRPPTTSSSDNINVPGRPRRTKPLGARKMQRDNQRRIASGASLDDSNRTAHSNRSNNVSVEPNQSSDEEDLETSFPRYMAPEKIQFIGLAVSEIRFRIHLMKDRDKNVAEEDTAFQYWDATVKCASGDYQAVTAVERPFQDARLSLGFFRLVEVKGVESAETVVIGHLATGETEANEGSSAHRNDGMRSQRFWYSAASAMLDIPPPSELVPCQSVAVELRYLSVADSADNRTSQDRSAIIHVGAPFIDTKFSIKDDIIRIVSEFTKTLSRRSNRDERKSSRRASRMLYRITVERGQVRLDPMIDVEFPSLAVQGQISGTFGFSLEGVFDQIKLKHGKQSEAMASDIGLSLDQLAALPETVRFRILLFLKDLSPFEVALGLPPSKNSFLQCRAVNNGIVKTAKRLAHEVRGSPPISGSHSRRSRAHMIDEIMEMDDETLSRLLDLHHGRVPNEFESHNLHNGGLVDDG